MHVREFGRIDPQLVPSRRLASGARMPAIGLGTFGSDRVSGAEIAAAVNGAAEVGYRHFDCASVYGNEALVGTAFTKMWAGGLRRAECWITSKLWNDKHAPVDVAAACEQSLRDLGLAYLDLYLVHWPFPNFHPIGCDVSSRSPDAKPYVHERFLATWQAMEALVARGLVRHIGTSNMTIPKLRKLLPDVAIRPACNELELHPHFAQPALFAYLQSEGIVPIGFSPLGSPGRPERDRTAEDTSPLTDPVILEIAAAHHAHPAEICLKWAVQRGQVPIPFSTSARNYTANLRAVTSDPLNESELVQIATVDRDCRLIKGHVFLWKENQTWHDLWDEDGEITPA